MSPKLFNAVSEMVFRNIQKQWRKIRFGVSVNGSLLCKLRFADDVIFLRTSKEQIRITLEDLAKAAAGVSLNIHMGETKILNIIVSGHLIIFGKKFDILPFTSSTDYLGRSKTMDTLHDTEMAIRIQKGWSKFFSFKSELCGKHIGIKEKIRLFNAVVTPTVLYGSSAWTMNAERSRLLRTSQRRMLRWMLGSVWQGFLEKDTRDTSDGADSENSQPADDKNSCNEDGDGETWVEWLRRRTRITEIILQSLKIDDWIQAQRRRKWTFD